jgi:hypothetical protein
MDPPVVGLLVLGADRPPYLSWRDLLRAWEQAQQQEMQRTLFDHFGGGARHRALSGAADPGKT